MSLKCSPIAYNIQGFESNTKQQCHLLPLIGQGCLQVSFKVKL